MKALVFFLLLILISTYTVHSRELEAVSDGDWTDSDTWGGHTPQAGDIITIPDGFTVQVTSNESYEGDAIQINIDGVLEFYKGGSKLWLPCHSVVNISETGSIVPSGTGDGSSKQLNICNDPVWEARDGTLKGPIQLKESTLPVELVSFIGEVEDNTIKLTWITASELNNDYFQVEKSEDGINFNVVSIIQGNGTTNSLSNYTAYDDMPNASTIYYRLKQVDFDGKFEYSDIISINIQNQDMADCKLIIKPNPCMGKCSADLSDCNTMDNKEIVFYIYDAFGNTVLASSPNIVSNGRAKFNFDSSNKLKPGMYIVRGKTNTEKVEEKVIINK